MSLFKFDTVAFFGRSLAEYVEMFNLNLDELKGKKVLDCPSGPASFVAEANKLGIDVTGVDPVYENDFESMITHGRDSIELGMAKSMKVTHLFHTEGDPDREIFKKEKLTALNRFSEDYPNGFKSHRYLVAKLPNLPFADKSFDIALSSYLLFFYADTKDGGVIDESTFDYDFHIASILELIRVTKNEIRIYPLCAPNVNDSQSKAKIFVDKIISDLNSRKIKTEIVPVKYKDVRGAETMLRLTW
jgi:hypothetical protein